MCTNSFRKAFGLLLIGVLGLGTVTATYADEACNVVPVTVVNTSEQNVAIRGSQGTVVVPGKTSTQIAFQTNHYYTKCGLIELGFDSQNFQKGLIAATSDSVNIRIHPDGTVEQIGLTDAGFKLDDYVSWWGLGAVLG